MAKKVLGKGLGAIISSSPTPVDSMEFAVSEAKDRIVELDVGAIRPNPDQPRTRFNEEEIEAHLRHTREVCERYGCPYELILKDISTVLNKPQRVFEWAKLAMRIVEE